MAQGGWSRTSRTIKAIQKALYDAFMDSDQLVVWLPPSRMNGKMHFFDGRVGGGYEMSLFYQLDATEMFGNSAFHGVMTMHITFAAVPDGTQVTIECQTIPDDIRPEDNDEGTRLSLDQLARHVEEKTGGRKFVDLLDLHTRAQAFFQSIVAAVTPDQVGNDTPNEGTDVRALINHVVGSNYVFVARLRGEPLPDRNADFLGDDQLAALRTSAEALQNAAFREPGALDRVIQLPMGDRTGLTLLRMRFNENLAHGWDIARATGQNTDREREMYEAALAQAPEIFGGPRLPGDPYAPEQPAPEGASPADKLAAYLGKRL